MRARGLGVGLALLLAASLLVSRPLPWEWSRALPVSAAPPAMGGTLRPVPADTFQLYYQLWLVHDGWRGGAPLSWDPYQFRTNGARWNLAQTFPPLSIPFVLLSPLGPVTAYNLLVLLSFPAAGLAAYFLARQLAGHPLAAAAAGAAFALWPGRLEALFQGQPAGFAAALGPLVLWGLELTGTGRRRGGAWLAGLALLGVAMLEPHHAYLLFGLLPLWLVVRRPAGIADISRGPGLLTSPAAILAGLMVGAVAWLLLLRAGFLLGSVAEAGRSLEEIRLASPGPRALLLPETYGGQAVAALAVVGLLAGDRRAIRQRLLLGGILLTGLLLGLGPTVPWVPVYETLHRWVPWFALIRNVPRFGFLVALAAPVLLAYGVRALLERLPRWWVRPVGVALIAVVTADTAPPHGIAMARLEDEPGYDLLRREARRVLYLPLWPGEAVASAPYLYHVTRTRVPMLNGYSPFVPRSYTTDVLDPLRVLNLGELGPAEYAALRRLSVSHVVLDQASAGTSPFPMALTRARLETSGALGLERAGISLRAFRVLDRASPRPSDSTSPAGVFTEAEAAPRGTGDIQPDPSASGGKTVSARGDGHRAGSLTTTPTAVFPRGRYRAVARVRGVGLSMTVAQADTGETLATQPLPPAPTWTDAPLVFRLDAPRPIAVRIGWDGHGEAAIDWVWLVFADRPDPEWTFEADELAHVLVEHRDPAAAGGVALRASPARPPGLVLRGPTRRYPAGTWELRLRVRGDRPGSGPVLGLSVTEPRGRTLAQRVVDASELSPDAYRDVTLAFVLPRPTVVDFSIRYLGRVGALLDQLAVHPG